VQLGGARDRLDELFKRAARLEARDDAGVGRRVPFVCVVFLWWLLFVVGLVGVFGFVLFVVWWWI
jgi:nitrate reductase NapE component